MPITCLDEYLRFGLHSEVSDVIHAAERWREHQTESRATRLSETIDALSDAVVAWNEAVDTYKDDNGDAADFTDTRGGLRR